MFVLMVTISDVSAFSLALPEILPSIYVNPATSWTRTYGGEILSPELCKVSILLQLTYSSMARFEQPVQLCVPIRWR